MVSVGVFASLLFAPDSAAVHRIPAEPARNALMGLAMGLTLLTLVYSPIGALSGAHMNPAFTLAFWRLGRIQTLDAAGYIVCQILGGLLGTLAIGRLIGGPFTAAPVRWAPTVPGRWGTTPAFAAEFGMTLVLMLVVLYTSNTKRLARVTGCFAAMLLALYITFESPVSGMSLNPARTLASAVPANVFTAWWVYALAPVLGMLAATEIFRLLPGTPPVHCCKLNHDHPGVCPHCGCDGPIDFDAHPQSPTSHDQHRSGRQ